MCPELTTRSSPIATAEILQKDKENRIKERMESSA